MPKPKSRWNPQKKNKGEEKPARKIEEVFEKSERIKVKEMWKENSKNVKNTWWKSR